MIDGLDVLELLRWIAGAAATAVETVGIVVIVVAVVRATARYVTALIRGAQPFPPEPLRIELGRSLALALEFLLGADILKTAIDPTWEDIAQLAAIAAIRIALNFFLDRELSQEARRFQQPGFGRPFRQADEPEDRAQP